MLSCLVMNTDYNLKYRTRWWLIRKNLILFLGSYIRSRLPFWYHYEWCLWKRRFKAYKAYTPHAEPAFKDFQTYKNVLLSHDLSYINQHRTVFWKGDYPYLCNAGKCSCVNYWTCWSDKTDPKSKRAILYKKYLKDINAPL